MKIINKPIKSTAGTTTRKSILELTEDRNLARVPKNRDNERGAALLIALIIITAFIFVVSAGTKAVSGNSAEAKKLEQTRQDAARAEYYVSMAEATLKYDVRRKYNEFQSSGKQKELEYGGDGSLPMFDSLTAAASKPLLNLDGSRSGESPATSTSLYGKSSLWTDTGVSDSRTYISNKIIEKQVVAPDGVEISSFRELYRRSMSGVSEPIYAFGYTIKARAGEFAEIVKEDTILLGPALVEDLAARANCSDLQLTGAANPANVTFGSSSQIDLNYSQAERVVIYNQGGSVVYDQVVTTEPTPRTVSYTTAPLTSPTNFVGEAVRGTCQIQVPISIGVTFNSNLSYTVNGAQSVNIIEGDQIQYDWQVSNADSAYTTSWITYSSDSANYFDNIYSNSIRQPGPVQNITSTLHARDTRVNGGSEQAVTVNVNVCRLPRVPRYEATPTSVVSGSGGNVKLTWQTAFASRLRIVNLSTGALVQDINDPAQIANGFLDIPAPSSNTSYGLEAISSCGAPTATAQTQVAVTTPPCPPPTNLSLFASPPSVTQGGNQNVTFNWSASGTIDSQSIDQGIGAVSGNSLTIVQPNTTTTYTYSATGCGVTNSATATVTVNSNPPPPPPSGRQFAETGGSRSGNRTAAQARAEIATNADGRITVEIVVYNNGRLDYLEITQNGVLLKRFNNIEEYFALGTGGNKFTPNVPFDPNQPITLNLQVTASINAGSLQETSVLNVSSAKMDSCTRYGRFGSPTGNFTCGYQGTDLSQIAASGVAFY